MTQVQPPKPVAKKKAKVLEKHVEAHLIRKMKALGGECYKWSSLNVRGVFDRICVFPDGQVYFVEVKKDDKAKLSPGQERFGKRMRELNVLNIDVVYGKDDVDVFIKSCGY